MLPFPVSFFFNGVAIALYKNVLLGKALYLFFMNCSTLSVPYFLADSSAFIILLGISEPAAMFCATPWKGSFKFPISPAICPSCLLISPAVDSLWLQLVFKFILFSTSFLSLASIWEFRMNPVDTGRKLNLQKTFRRCPGRLLNVLCMFNLRPVSTRKSF